MRGNRSSALVHAARACKRVVGAWAKRLAAKGATQAAPIVAAVADQQRRIAARNQVWDPFQGNTSGTQNDTLSEADRARMWHDKAAATIKFNALAVACAALLYALISYLAEQYGWWSRIEAAYSKVRGRVKERLAAGDPLGPEQWRKRPWSESSIEARDQGVGVTPEGGAESSPPTEASEDASLVPSTESGSKSLPSGAERFVGAWSLVRVDNYEAFLREAVGLNFVARKVAARLRPAPRFWLEAGPDGPPALKCRVECLGTKAIEEEYHAEAAAPERRSSHPCVPSLCGASPCRRRRWRLPTHT